jgi:hypothetical protein
MKPKSKEPITAQEMQRRSARSRWRNVPETERSAIMRRVVQARWAQTKGAKSS